MNEKEVQKTKNIIADDMLLTTGIPTSAGSKMLDGYQSFIESEAIMRVKAAGYTLVGKADVGEFGIDLIGETSARGAFVCNGTLKNASAEALIKGDATGALCLDVNGSPRRAAAQSGLVCLKPTYGAISRYGVISVVPSGETVSILAKSTEDCRDLFYALANPNETECTSVRRVAVLTSLNDGIEEGVKQVIGTAIPKLQNSGISTTYIENRTISLAKAVWNSLLCAELCKSTARYDGIRYGYRAESFSSLEELYTNSRTEGFGDLVKAAILWGSEVLSAQNYKNIYEKALRVRRVIADEFSKLFEDFDAVLLPTCSKIEYTEEEVARDKYIAFEENSYTAPASLTGLPAVVAGGVQLIGKANAEHALLDIANILSGEGR